MRSDLVSIINAAFGWHRHPRNGKVARLPEPVRNLINQMLDDGLTYRQLLIKLQQTVSLPYPLSEMNISNWYRGGFQDWRKYNFLAQAGIAPTPDAKVFVLPQRTALPSMNLGQDGWSPRGLPGISPAS